MPVRPAGNNPVASLSYDARNFKPPRFHHFHSAADIGKKHSTFRRTQKASGSGKSSLSCFKCCRNSHDGFRERTPFRWMVFPPVQRPTQKELVVTFQSLAIPLEVY